MDPNAAIEAIKFNLNSLNIYDQEQKKDVVVTPFGYMYTVEGIMDGMGLRKMSMSEIVMVLCLSRATAMESRILSLMAEMNYNTEALNELTNIEEKLVNGVKLEDIEGPFYYQGVEYKTVYDFLTALEISDFGPSEAMTVLSTLRNLLQNENVNVCGEIGPISYQGEEYGNINDLCLAVDNVSFADREEAFFYIDEFRDTLFWDDRHVAMRLYGEVSISLLSNLVRLGVLTYAQWEEVEKESVGYNKFTVNADTMFLFFNANLRNLYLNELETAEELALAENQERIEKLEADTDALISAIETKMDSMNSFSQQKMIELQSYTNKRDQSFDMITNILKSLNNSLVGNANNL